ncbi:CheR family methyltransferase [Clostridium cylindrosporum]|uniref:protein-glutamate O-methyltransferase n=1 Tax=Clostridium cylindrosporum DSM 605 TaxID=1121307 RepID=A0A0J8D826_CLOCY|nr:protein-glutamate O-methyltransferase CheR [Clostridium cylindrosporum]KMT22007.1 chemotaxis protein methyltransferase 2 [Clostridium cylindrosporum DSM 605]
MKLDDVLYKKYTDLIYSKTGLSYELNKKYFVEKRIENCMEDINISDFLEYYHFIRFSPNEKEFYKLINELTVNETYFFRDFPQLRNFAEDVLPIIVKEKERKKDYSIKIWSAACATGEEAYTLAIILLEMLDKPEVWDIKIIASDINNKVLDAAKKGIYDDRAMREMPQEYLVKYFTVKGDRYHIDLKVKKYVEFKRLNLFNSDEIFKIGNCDFIFCRNVLIYFSTESRKKVVEALYHSLSPGGFIFLGHSESIARISSSYKAQKIGDTIVYSKQLHK